MSIWCKACRHSEETEFAALIDAGKGDAPIARMRFRCTSCGSRLTDAVVTGSHFGARTS